MERRKETSKAIEENSSILTDLAIVEKGVNTKEGQLSKSLRQQIEEIKEKYGIKSWPPEKDALKLEIQTLKEEIDDLTASIDNFDEKFAALLENKEEADAILKQMGHDPETLKKNVRKNILRKHLMKNSDISTRLQELQIQ